MYYDKFLPFYMTYADSSLYSRERIQEQEFALMKSYYPETARKIQEKVEEECQLMDYEGSRLYDCLLYTSQRQKWQVSMELHRIM